MNLRNVKWTQVVLMEVFQNPVFLVTQAQNLYLVKIWLKRLKIPENISYMICAFVSYKNYLEYRCILFELWEKFI